MARTLVYGLGSSGTDAARVLARTGEKNLLLADKNDDPTVRAALKNLGMDGVLGATPEVLKDVDRVVVSPGVSPRDPVLQAAEKKNVPVIPEVGFGLKMLKGEVRVAAVTGTNGKTTVMDMIRSFLKASGVDHAVAGNSWRALSGCLEEVREAGVLVLELSSFQLHYLDRPGFEVAALLNVRPDHLNWHSSYEEYVRDKLKVFDGQKEGDLALLSASDAVGAKAAAALGPRALLVGAGDTRVRNRELLLRGETIAREEELRFSGAHNYENVLFAAAAAQKLGASVEGIRGGLLEYRLKPHRMEVVLEEGGIVWIDDSKATNPAAVVAALEAVEESGRKVVLILGGSEKATDFTELLPFLEGCRAVVCQGEAGPRIHEFLRSRGFGEVSHLVKNLPAAVREARALAFRGDAVLLSPGCASFDQHAGYAERGEEFSRLAEGSRAGQDDRRVVGG